MTIEEVLFLSEEYETREQLEKACDFWDATTAGSYAWCPRKAQYGSRMSLTNAETALPLVTGSAVHAGMDVLYTSADDDLAVETVVQTFGERPPPSNAGKFAHLHVGFVEAVFRNYLDWRRKRDTFEPIVVRLDELDMTNVVAAVLKILPDERVVLGESKLVMQFNVGGQRFVYAGKPDLPIRKGGQVYIMDHKVSCGGYLSEWWFSKHALSNQLRCYMAMIESIMGVHVHGALVNGIYAGENALQTTTKSGKRSNVTRFDRYGPLLFDEGHVHEALWNQFAWREIAMVYEDLAEQYPAMHKRYGYPQNTGKSCQGCNFFGLCQETPRDRRTMIVEKFVQRRRSFLDL